MSKRTANSRLHRSASFHHPSTPRSSHQNTPFSPYISSAVPKNLQLQVYVDSHCRTHHTARFAGYGVFAPLHSIRIAEPLPGSVQTAERAELRSLHAALELVHGIRARRATVHVYSTFVVDVFNNRLSKWQANNWRTKNGTFIRNRRLWTDVALLRTVFADRGVHIDVKSRSRRRDHDMKVAYRLAKHGASLHVTCDLCRKTHGRQYLNHRCQPVCTLDRCSGRVLRDVEAYTRHLHRRHRKTCDRDGCDMEFECFTQQELDEHNREVHGRKIYSCDFCGKPYESIRHATNHMRLRCKSAPYCEDCGKRFTSRRDFEHHNGEEGSDDGSSSSEDDEEESYWRGRGGDSDKGDESDSEESIGSSSESEGDDEHEHGGLFMTDGRGRQWEIDEYGLRNRRGEAMSEGFVPHQFRVLG